MLKKGGGETCWGVGASTRTEARDGRFETLTKERAYSLLVFGQRFVETCMRFHVEYCDTEGRPSVWEASNKQAHDLR